MPANLTPSDEHLVVLAQQGSLEAFTTLYERHLGSVFNRVRFSVPETDVEDVTQEVFIAMMRSLHGFRGEAKFSTWLQTLTRRNIADYYRRRPPLDDPIEPATNDDDDDLEVTNEFARYSAKVSSANWDDQIALRQAFQSLPENYQEVLLLRFADGLQFNEIAELQEVSLEATKSLFRRAVASLQRQLEP